MKTPKTFAMKRNLASLAFLPFFAAAQQTTLTDFKDAVPPLRSGY